MKVIFTKMLVLLIVQIVLVSGVEPYDDDIDNFINMLLNGDDIENGSSIEDYEVSDEQPFFSDGLWKCGNCDVIDESKLIHSEVNDVDTNDIGDEPFVVQVALAMDNMRCVTVVAGAESNVRREAGSCARASVTLSVSAARHFIVNVYGE